MERKVQMLKNLVHVDLFWKNGHKTDTVVNLADNKELAILIEKTSKCSASNGTIIINGINKNSEGKTHEQRKKITDL